ncbi:MAG: ECF transporter S component [Odoribacteraceae bacterium]|jgi:hypothetical protein|nr:ECF transporter S component [Odoribacteraceae bacterium]
MKTTVKLYSLSYSDAKTYLFALLFVAGNLLLPLACHLVPDGGRMLLPLYFFTLIAAYKYGLQVGLLAAVLSPVANALLFGMPAAAALPLIVIKSCLLAACAAYAARRSGRITFVPILLAVVACHGIGLAVESAWNGFTVAASALKMAVPGILLQVLGGYALLKATARQ